MSIHGETRLKGVAIDGSADCNAIYIMSSLCIVCKTQILGAFVALGSPYYAAVHPKCKHLFPFDGDYPHQHAVSVYVAAANSTNRLNNE